MKSRLPDFRKSPLRAAVLASAVGAAIVIAGGAFALGNQAPTADAGLSDAERDALYQRLSLNGRALQRDYLEHFQSEGRDPRKLQQVELMVSMSHGPLHATLADAVAGSEIIVRGRVSSVRYAFDQTNIPFSVAEVTVREVLKGEVPSNIAVTVPGAPELLWDGERSQELLGFIPATPPHPVGDDVVLLLLSSDPGRYRVVAYNGQFVLDGGKVHAPDNGNRFRDDVEGRSAESFLAEIGGLVR